MLFVQDYVRVTGSDDGNASERRFYTYNQSVDHPYFASRPGFVRAKVKCQGMVGVVGDGGKTRLTWLVNCDFGGLVPSSFTTGLLVAFMAYPIQVVQKTSEYVKKQEGSVIDIASSSLVQEDHGKDLGAVSREAFEELKEKLKRAEKRVEVLRDELTASFGEKERKLETELERALKENAKKDEALRTKDGLLKEKDMEVMELRRRLPRVVDEEV